MNTDSSSKYSLYTCNLDILPGQSVSDLVYSKKAPKKEKELLCRFSLLDIICIDFLGTFLSKFAMRPYGRFTSAAVFNQTNSKLTHIYLPLCYFVFRKESIIQSVDSKGIIETLQSTILPYQTNKG